jgi:hypothetical protein
MKNLHKTLFFTLGLVLVAIFFTYFIQSTQQNSVNGCSYLDPFIIDILAFSFAAFLVIEGLVRIIEHSNASLMGQLTRSMRIAIGAAIITIHIMQFMHK